MVQSVSAPRSPMTAALGTIGIMGGVVLLAAFAVDIPPSVNTYRLLLFNAGAIAVVIGVHRRQAAAAPGPDLIGTVPAIVANAWYFGMTILGTGRPEPFAGDFGFVYFLTAMAMWSTDALFGLVTLRLGAVPRGGALALAVGSVFAVSGIDRLGLTSMASPTLFGPLALTGVALNGVGWIVLGLDLVMRSRRSR